MCTIAVDASPARPVTRTAPPSLAFVACIESGPLEEETVRMVESLRLFGGRYADADVCVVRSRPGPPLLSSTRRRLIELGAQLLKPPHRRRYRWHHHFNKPFALMLAEQELTADTVAWADSDILFLDEPQELALADNEEFAAQPEWGVIGSSGPEDPDDPFWRRAFRSFGLEPARQPWVTTPEGDRIRFYLNSGLFVYRRDTAFGRDYHDDCMRFLDTGVASTHTQVHFADQVVLGLTVLRRRLTFRPMSIDGNYHTTLIDPQSMHPALMRRATVLHYHDTMYSGTWPKMLAVLEASHPEVYEWVISKGPIEPHAGPIGARAFRETLRLARGVARRIHYKQREVAMPPRTGRKPTQSPKLAPTERAAATR